MQHDFYSEEVWVPVTVKGFGRDFEMCPLGYVRRARPDRGGAKLWLLPEESDLGPVYRLVKRNEEADRDEALEAEVAAGDIVALFGGKAPAHGGWGAQLRRKALAENASLRGVVLDETVCRRVEDGAEGLTIEALLDAAGVRCPWANSTVGGDARGADPVLGY